MTPSSNSTIAVHVGGHGRGLTLQEQNGREETQRGAPSVSPRTIRQEQQASEANRRMHSARKQHKHLTQATFDAQRGYTDRSGCTATGALRKVIVQILAMIMSTMPSHVTGSRCEQRTLGISQMATTSTGEMCSSR